MVIGLGVVGRALYQLLARIGDLEVYGYDIDPSRSIHSLETIPRPVDYLHIAIHYNQSFVAEVKRYAELFKPRIVFIHSTVAPGTSRKIYEDLNKSIGIVYTPVRGLHTKMLQHMLFWSKWIAALPPEIEDEAARHLEQAGFKVHRCRCKPESLELAKLWETVYRAIMIAAWQELHRIAKYVGADIETVARFVAEVHQVLRDRPVYYPGVIGGTCLIPNTEILSNVYPSKLLEFVLESNTKRIKELENPEIAQEVEKLRNIVMSLIDRKYYDP